MRRLGLVAWAALGAATNPHWHTAVDASSYGATKGGRRNHHQRIRSIQRNSLPAANDEDEHQQHFREQQRALKVNGPLDVLNRVWNDAANQEASDVESDCVKVKKGKGKGSIKGSATPSSAITPSASPAPTATSVPSPPPTSKSLKSLKGSKYCQDRPTGALPSAPSRQTPAPTRAPTSNDLVPPAPGPPTAEPSTPTDFVPPPSPTAAGRPSPPGTSSAAPTPPPQQQVPPPQPPQPEAPPSASPVASPTAGGVSSPTAASSPPSAPTLLPESPTATTTAPVPQPTAAAPQEPTAPPPQPTQGDNGNSNSARCAEVADETLVTNATESDTWRLEMVLQLAATTDVETALQQMQVALQSQVAPTLTNCASEGEGGSGGESAQRQLHQRSLQTAGDETGVQNVVFGPRAAREFVTCEGQASSSSICINTGGRVTAYGSVPDSFSDDLLSAVEATDYEGVDGLQQVTGAAATSGGDPVPEGSGVANDDRSDGGGDSVIEEPKSNVSPTDGAISAGAAVGIALAALVVLLIAMFALRRRQRGYDRRDAALKLAAHTEDEDDLVLGSGGEGAPGGADDDEDDRIPGTRKVHVLDEDDSLMSHSLFGDHRNVEIRPVRVPFDEANDRHSSIKFVATAAAPIRPSPAIPPDASRTYAADDTVLL